MSKLTILHLSDLHFRPTVTADSSPSVRALLKDVKETFVEKGRRPDIIVFSGDLAFSGHDSDAFHKAWDFLLRPLAELCELNDDRVIICPGNHDISRDDVRSLDALETGFAAQLTSTAAVNRFIEKAKSGSHQESLSLGRLSNFFKFFDSKFQSETAGHPLIRSRVVSIGDCNVGFAILNSCWRATGEADDVDHGKLLIGERSLDDALASLTDCQIKIAVAHHPTEWLAPFDRDVVEPFIRTNFDLFCIGHMHEAKPKLVASPEGMSVVSQAGSAYASPDWLNSYQLIELDRLTGDFEFLIQEYQRGRREYDVATSVAQGGRFSVRSSRSQCTQAASQVELFLRDNRDLLRQKACEQIDFADFPRHCRDKLLDDFVPPPLVHRIFVETDSEKERVKETEEVDVDDLIEDDKNVLIVGERQSGRTSLAFFLATQIAKGAGVKPSIPVWIDIRDYTTNYYGLRRAISKFYDGIPQGF